MGRRTGPDEPELTGPFQPEWCVRRISTFVVTGKRRDSLYTRLVLEHLVEVASGEGPADTSPTT